MSFLSLETALVERLKATLPSGVQVLNAADLAGVAEGSQPTPAVHVVYDSGAIKQLTPDGRAAKVEQLWYAVIAVRNVRAVRSGSAARGDASALVDQVLAALMGWQAAPIQAPLMLSGLPKTQYAAGFMYLPLAFKAEVVLSNPPKN